MIVIFISIKEELTYFEFFFNKYVEKFYITQRVINYIIGLCYEVFIRMVVNKTVLENLITLVNACVYNNVLNIFCLQSDFQI